MSEEAKDPKFQRKVWYLASPFYQYVEDVKKVARDNGLRIIDATVTTDRSFACEDPPAVTIKPEYQPKEKAAGHDAGDAVAAAKLAEANKPGGNGRR